MTLPDQIGPIFPDGNSMNGIISMIRGIIPDPISAGIVTATANHVGSGEINNMILSSASTYWQSYSSPDSYIQFDFHDRYLFPTHYSFRGFSGTNYARSWYLYGFNSGEESDVSKWFLLGNDTSEGSSYCEPLSSGLYCGNNNIGTFSVRPTIDGFRYFRWVLSQCSNPSRNQISIRGIELFGFLSLNNNFSPTYSHPKFSQEFNSTFFSHHFLSIT